MKKTDTRTASKQLRAIQTSRHLRMAHYRHTGRVLPRHSTSYPTLIMVMLCIGVFLATWTHAATAAVQSYRVNTSVPGPPPTVPATIDAPTDNSQFTSAPITVSGTCPLNTYVGLTRNSFTSGVALCDASGHYQLQTALFSGINQLVAYDYSFTDAQGPPSTMVSVTYVPPLSAPGGTGGSASGGAGNDHSTGSSQSTIKTPYNPSSPSSSGLPEPLLLKSNFTFLGYYIGQPASWQVDIEGGTAPYAIDAEWGDGHQQLYSKAAAGTISLEHTYAKTGGYHGSYVVKITATDANGSQTFLQLLAIISPQPKTVVAGSSSGGQHLSASSDTSLFGPVSFNHMMTYVWSGYGVILLMMSSFWLGERRELRYIHLRPRRHRHA